MNLAAFARGSSTFTPTTDNPRPANSRWSLSSAGISARHGPHQLAQKSSSTARPRIRLNEKTLPDRSSSVKSGAATAPVRETLEALLSPEFDAAVELRPSPSNRTGAEEP